MSDGPPADRPGGRTFSIEGRPAAGLYLAGWMLSGLGLAVLFVAFQAGPPAGGVLIMAGLLLLTLGLAAAAGYQLLARRTRPADAYRGPSPLIVFGCLMFAVIAIGLALRPLGLDPTTPVGALIAIGLQVAGYLLATWLFVVRSGALSWREIARPVGSLAGAAGYGVAVMLPVTFLALIGGGLVATLLGVEAPQVLPPPETAADLLAVAIAAAVLAPIGEEFFFRAFALTAWLRDLGARSALIRSTAFFAVVHLLTITTTDFVTGLLQAILVLTVIVPVGFVLGWLYLRRGLVAAITGHFAYNGILLALLQLAQQLGPLPN